MYNYVIIFNSIGIIGIQLKTLIIIAKVVINYVLLIKENTDVISKFTAVIYGDFKISM